MRDERDEGYFADGASVGKVKQECSSLVDDTTAMVKSEVLFHSATSTDGASRMSSIKGQTLPSLIRLRFYKSEGEVLRARRKECKRVSEQVKRRIEKVTRKNCRFNRVERKEMTSGDGGPSHRVILKLVPRVLSYPPYGARERETLENAGHVAPEQNYFSGRSTLSHIFLSGLFATFTQ